MTRRVRRLRVMTFVFGAIAALSLIALLVIVLRNSYTHGLITFCIVLAIVGILSSGAAVLSIGFWRDALTRGAATEKLEPDTGTQATD